VESVLRAAIAPAMANAILRLLRAEMAYSFPEWQKTHLAGQAMSGRVGDAYDRWFVAHVSEWFARLLETDSQGFLSWKACPVSLLANLPGQVVDDEGRWIWERFTRSRLEDWSTSSLLLEWRHIAGDSGSDGVKLRTLNARTVDPDDVGDAVMSRLAGVHRGHATAPDLSADQFVERAIQPRSAGPISWVRVSAFPECRRSTGRVVSGGGRGGAAGLPGFSTSGSSLSCLVRAVGQVAVAAAGGPSAAV